jgi:hypothetical protein
MLILTEGFDAALMGTKASPAHFRFWRARRVAPTIPQGGLIPANLGSWQERKPVIDNRTP